MSETTYSTRYFRRKAFISTLSIFFVLVMALQATFIREGILTYVSILAIIFIGILISAMAMFLTEKKYKDVEVGYLYFLKDAIFYIIFVIPIWLLLYIRIVVKGPITIVYVDLVILFFMALTLSNPFLLIIKRKSYPLTDLKMVEEVKRLSEKLGVRISDVRVIDWEKQKIPNAFQSGFRTYTIFISNYLKENLTFEENIAVLAHEISHAAHKHLQKTFIYVESMILIIINLFLFAQYYPTQGNLSLIFAITGFILIYVGLIFFLPFLQRHFEKEADISAAKTVDPKWLISALLRLSDLGLIPKKISKFWNSSHPDISTRVKYLQELNTGER